MGPDKTRRQEEAVAWFAALRAGAMPLEQRQEYDAWRADPLNQSALDEVHQKWGELAALKELAPRKQFLQIRKSQLAAAAALVVACLGAGLMWSMVGRSETIATVVGEQKVQSLPDGSVVAVNVVSSLSYDISDTVRVVDLAEGEAAFTVKADSDRPFVVRAADYEVRAIGTTFNVRRRGEGFEVAVREGKVEVCAATGERARETLFTLEAGQLLQLPARLGPDSRNLPKPTRLPPDQVAEWRERVVTYEDVSVATIVEDVNRYFKRKVVVKEESMAERRVTIRLEVDNRDEALATLASLLGGEIRRAAGEDILKN